MWVRREILVNYRLPEKYGPRPGVNRLMGSETSFVIEMMKKGHRVLYVPEADVGHCLSHELLTKQGIRERVYRAGRSHPYLKTLMGKEVTSLPLYLELIMRLAGLGKNSMLYVFSLCCLDPSKRFLNTCDALNGIAYNIEVIRIICGRGVKE